MNKKLNTNLIELVNILSDGQYHSGTVMGASLKMTRGAVWKAIRKLQSYGVNVQFIRGRGYMLSEPLMLLDVRQIKKHLQHARLDVELFESIDSTNDFLKNFKNSQSIRICLAEQQIKGKGRLSREWYSPFGKNIYLSCLFPFRKDVSELSGLSLVMSLAIIKTLHSYGINEQLHVKWPNDILYAHQKISGSLIEIQAETHGTCQAIIGIGINVNMLKEDNKCLSQPWTSMQAILGYPLDRNRVCARLIDDVLDYLQRFVLHGFVSFVNEWEQSDCLMNQMIAIKNVNECVEGCVIGINDQGHLLLRMPQGDVRAFSSGDATIVK